MCESQRLTIPPPTGASGTWRWEGRVGQQWKGGRVPNSEPWWMGRRPRIFAAFLRVSHPRDVMTWGGVGGTATDFVFTFS